MSRADAERILRRWGWTPERIAALPPGGAEFIAEDVPRDKAFLAARLGEQAKPQPPCAEGPLSAKRAKALAEIRRVGLGDRRTTLPIGPEALKEALENIVGGA